MQKFNVMWGQNDQQARKHHLFHVQRFNIMFLGFLKMGCGPKRCTRNKCWHPCSLAARYTFFSCKSKNLRKLPYTKR